jgi:hypothetical protein
MLFYFLDELYTVKTGRLGLPYVHKSSMLLFTLGGTIASWPSAIATTLSQETTKQGVKVEGTQDQQSRFSWHVYPAQQYGHGGRTTPVFPPRYKRSVKHIIVQRYKYVHFQFLFLPKSVLIKILSALDP